MPIPAESTPGVAAPLALRMPYRRDALGFEFIPSLDDAALVAQSGQPFTKVGTPTLNGEAYDFGAGDSITFDGDMWNALLNADTTGWTFFLRLPKPASALPEGKTLLTYTNWTTDWPFAVAAYPAPSPDDISIGGGNYFAYTEDFYEGATNAGGHPGIYPNGAATFCVQYDRAHVPAVEGAFTFDDSDADRGRFRYYFDGVETPTDGDGSGADTGNADVNNGVIALAEDGLLYIGDDTEGKPYYRIGPMWLFTKKLTPTEIANISAWIKHTFVIPVP